MPHDIGGAEMALLPDDVEPRALSRHSGGTRIRFPVAAVNAGAWCHFPANPMMGQFVLQPNRVGDDAACVLYGPVKLPIDADAVTVFLECTSGRVHGNTLALEVEVVDAAGKTLGTSRRSLRHGEEAVSTTCFSAPRSRRVGFRFTAEFDDYGPDRGHGSARIHYAVLYKRNPLNDLFNAVGSDKGTEVLFGGGVPHCYALDYHRLFEPLRDETFAMLEIGLDNASKASGAPRDAPSLRAWREYFPNASLFGYDVNDFLFFEQERTATFQGDQGSAEDLERFLETHDHPRFRLILDDGSHASSDQQISLAKLFASLEPGGLYVIEDLQWQPYEEELTTLDMLTEFWRTERVRSPYMSDADARLLTESIDVVRIYKPNDAEFAVIRKRSE